MRSWNIQMTKITNRQVKIIMTSFVVGFLIGFVICWQTMIYVFRIMK